MSAITAEIKMEPIMKSINCSLPDSLYEALEERARKEKANRDHVVSVALSQYFGKAIHTLFQVSTSAALVEGLYQGAVRVSRLLQPWRLWAGNVHRPRWRNGGVGRHLLPGLFERRGRGD